jgi:hypothetical protein
MFEDVFIAIYTNECKSYCDYNFFNHLFDTNMNGSSVNVVDNSFKQEYTDRLKRICEDNADVWHIDIDKTDVKTQFQRNVTESLLSLRDKFLGGDWKYFVILESDVLPKDKDWLKYLLEATDQADIIGGLYYKGFHGPELWEGEPRVIRTHHVLSGCTLYKREVILKFPFRWSMDNIGAFPDAWISVDAGQEFKLANYTKVVCDHIEMAPGVRVRGIRL